MPKTAKALVYNDPRVTKAVGACLRDAKSPDVFRSTLFRDQLPLVDALVSRSKMQPLPQRDLPLALSLTSFVNGSIIGLGGNAIIGRKLPFPERQPNRTSELMAKTPKPATNIGSIPGEFNLVPFTVEVYDLTRDELGQVRGAVKALENGSGTVDRLTDHATHFIRIREMSISRIHAALLIGDDGRVDIVDLDSYSGVTISETRIPAKTSSTVQDGSQIVLDKEGTGFGVSIRPKEPAN